MSQADPDGDPSSSSSDSLSSVNTTPCSSVGGEEILALGVISDFCRKVVQKGKKFLCHNPKRMAILTLRMATFGNFRVINCEGLPNLGSGKFTKLSNNNDYEVAICACGLWKDVKPLATPTIEGGVNSLFLFADCRMIGDKLAIDCPKNADCMDANGILLKDIVKKLDELGPDIILIVIGQGPTEMDLSGVATARVAVLMATANEEEDTEPDYDDIKEFVLKKLKKKSDPRKALKALNDYEICNADVHKEWMNGRGAVPSQLQSAESRIPTEKEFRRLLKTIQSSNSEQRFEAEKEWRQIDASVKRTLLMIAFRNSEDNKTQSFILIRLSSVFECIGAYWKDEDLSEFARQMIEVAHSEYNATLIDEIANVLIKVARLRIAMKKEKGWPEIQAFVNGSTECKNKAVKLIALKVAAKQVWLGTRRFYDTMINDESVKAEAIKLWSSCVIEDYRHWRDDYRRDVNGENFNDEIIDCGITINKLCETDLSMKEGAPLWAVVQLALVSPFSLVYGAAADEIIKNCIQAVWNETDKKSLNDLINAIYHFALDAADEETSNYYAEEFTPKIMCELVKILTAHPKINTNMKRRLLSIFKILPSKSIDFGCGNPPPKKLMREIESDLDHPALRLIALGALKNIEERFGYDEDVERVRQKSQLPVLSLSFTSSDNENETQFSGQKDDTSIDLPKHILDSAENEGHGPMPFEVSVKRMTDTDWYYLCVTVLKENGEVLFVVETEAKGDLLRNTRINGKPAVPDEE